MIGKGIKDQIKSVETYSTLTQEKFNQIIDDVYNNTPIIETGKFPSTEEINALEDNRTYLIPTPVGKVYMTGKAAKEFNNELVKEARDLLFKTKKGVHLVAGKKKK